MHAGGGVARTTQYATSTDRGHQSRRDTEDAPPEQRAGGRRIRTENAQPQQQRAVHNKGGEEETQTRQHKAGPEIHKGKFSGACSESRCVINPYQRKRMPWTRSRVLREDSADKHSGKWNGVRSPTTQWLFTCKSGALMDEAAPSIRTSVDRDELGRQSRAWSRSHASRGRLLEHEAMRFTRRAAESVTCVAIARIS